LAIWAQYNDLDCQRCNNQLRKVRGCSEEVPPRTIEGYQITRCPWRYITYTELAYIDLFYYFKNGFLPNEGGWLKQPMKLISIITFIDNLLCEYSERKNGATS